MRQQRAWLTCRCGHTWEMVWPGAHGEWMEIRCPGCGHVCVLLTIDNDAPWTGWDEHVSPGCRFDLEAVDEEEKEWE